MNRPHLSTERIELAGSEFWLVGSPAIERSEGGRLFEYTHVVPAGQQTNPFAAGPFCKFVLPGAPSEAGVYAILVGDRLKYIGRCIDLQSAFGKSGCGGIGPSNIRKNGQSTNCKLNSRILELAKRGIAVHVWFHGTADFVGVKRKLVAVLAPPWSGSGGSDDAI